MTLAERILKRSVLTAPHFLAYLWVLGQLGKMPGSLLDFGSRHSKLPELAVDNGWRVTAYDRADLSERGSLSESGIHNCYGQAIPLPFADETFNAITAVWAIQHNEVAEQTNIVKELVRVLKPGGVLLVVSSFSTWATVHQENRADPQWVLNYHDHLHQIILPSGLAMNNPPTHFYYEHGTENGDYCDAPDANAICYRLDKPS